MKPYLRLGLAAAILLAACLFVGCKGDDGPAGPAGTNPPLAPVITAVYAVPDSIGTNEITTLIASAYDPNGDSLRFQWTTTNGTLATPTASTTHWTADSIGLFTITVAVSDGQRTTNGHVLVGVNRYVPTVTPSYLGNDVQNCNPCHAGAIESWQTTPHSMAFDSSAAGVEHKTTGFNTALNNGGYDDDPSSALENVQCEACHGPLGPGAAVTNHPSISNDAMTGAACGQCHAEWTEYTYSGHGTAMVRAGGHEEFRGEFGHSPCWNCHVSEGFIKLWDADWTERPVPHLLNQITCGSCHDPHNWSEGNPEQLRAAVDFTLPFGGPGYPAGFTISGWGKGQVCGQCHHSRRDSTYIFNAIANGGQRATPHESPQGDMLAGRGSYEIPGFTYERENQHDIGSGTFADVCLRCHMIDETLPYPHANHNFHPDVRACTGCHGTPTDFDIDGKQTEIVDLLDSLGQMLPNTVDENGHYIVNIDTRDTLLWTVPEARGGLGLAVRVS